MEISQIHLSKGEAVPRTDAARPTTYFRLLRYPHLGFCLWEQTFTNEAYGRQSQISATVLRMLRRKLYYEPPSVSARAAPFVFRINLDRGERHL
jgi:hypothetical protein